MTSMICPFCGVVSDVRHDTQQACIDALHTEIARTRRVLKHVTEPLPPASLADEARNKQLT